MAKGSRPGGGGGAKKAAPKQKPTKAVYIENMNEAQLDLEIRNYERKIERADKAIEKIQNSGSVKTAEQIMYMFPGGVGGSAVNSSYRNKMNRYGEAVSKMAGIQEQQRHDKAYLDKLKAAKKQVNGTGMTLDQYRKSIRSKGGTLAGKWSTSTEKTGYGLFGNSPQKVYKNGDYSIMKPHAYAYSLFNGGRKVGDYPTLKAAKAAAEKNK